MNERMYWVAWSLIPKLGGTRLLALNEHFGSLEAAWHAPVHQLVDVPGIGSLLAAEAAAARKRRDPSEAWAMVQARGVEIVTWVDATYPAPLRPLTDPPPVLYVKGALPDWSKAVSMVGTRDASDYGKHVAGRMSAELAGLGAVIVSGLASGIDRASHEGALSVAGGITVAVLGSGLNRIYPAENGHLAQQIARSGCVLSEYPPNTAAHKRHFPYRNRIISGLGQGCIVVEARYKSGTYHTVEHAIEQGRPVLAVPGPIYSPGSEAPHELIRNGARMAAGVADVLEELGWIAPAAPVAKKTSDDPREQSVLDALAQGPRSLDGMATATGLGAAGLGGLLTVMELKGLVRALPGARYESA